MEYVVTELTANRSFTWVARSPGVVITAVHRLEPTFNGTRVRLAVSQDGWLGSVMRRYLRRLTERYLAQEAAGLKAAAEAGEG